LEQVWPEAQLPQEIVTAQLLLQEPQFLPNEAQVVGTHAVVTQSPSRHVLLSPQEVAALHFKHPPESAQVCVPLPEHRRVPNGEHSFAHEFSLKEPYTFPEETSVFSCDTVDELLK
jgi:hypothetical protein